MKKALLTILPILVLTLFLTPIYSASVAEPQLKITGKITTDVTNLNDILSEVDTSMFETITVKNVTIDVLNIELSTQFENATSVTPTGSTTQFDYVFDILQDANYISYLLIKMTNKTALSASTWYYLEFENTIEKNIDNNYYLLYFGKISVLAGSVDDYILTTKFVFFDEYGNEREIWLTLRDTVATEYVDSTSGALVHVQDARVSHAIQIKISSLLSRLGKAWTLVKLTKVKYYISFKTSVTLSASYQVASMIYAALVSPTAFKINGVLVNNTKYLTNITTKTITATLPVNKIADVQIDFEGVLKTSDISNVPEDLARVYFWQFKFNSTWYSNLQANLTKGDADDIVYAYLNGVDITSSLNTTGYYTFPVSTDTQYVVQVKAKFSKDEYDELVGTFTAPSPWQPTKAIPWWFWYIIFLLASALGIAGAKEVAAQKLREIKSNP